MKTKTIKMLVFIATILMILSITTSVLAVSPIDITASTNVNTNEITDLGQRIIGILQVVGVVLSVVILTVIGIKYMMGSAEEKAEYKKTMMPYIIGAAFIFMAPTIANIIYSFFVS